ncbi:MAG: hypothetical protein ACRDI3_05335, partial [Actinomycetota bacterium]
QDLIPAGIVGLVLVGALVLFGWAHRAGRTSLLVRLGALSERRSGLPRWAALPLAIAGGALLVAVLGFYGDVASHIDNGRDPGPFANTWHWLIIGGLAGIALAGYVSVLLGSGPTPTAIRIRPGWNAPAGGALMLLCGVIAVAGFPLDDVWHRLFGQDVTLWSPTHMQMVGGATLSTIALWILAVEGLRHPVDEERATRTHQLSGAAVAGAVLLGLSAFHAEFDYSVPQFRLLYHPIVLMLSAGTALVAARIHFGRGGALKAVGFFLLIRGLLSVLIGPVLGHTTLHFPLYLVEALVVEAVAARVGTDRQLSFGALAGIGIGTLGLAAEWGWSHVWMTIPWPATLLPEGVVFGITAGVAGGLLGSFIGRALAPPELSRQRAPVAVGFCTAAAVLLVLFYPLPTDAALDGTATMSLTDVNGRDGRWVDADIVMEPEDVAVGAEWFNVTSWQGGGSVVTELERIGPGHYETPVPIPVHGEWKALLRLQRGTSLMATPIFLPKDEAIPAPAVPAEQRVTRELGSDKRIVLREAKDVEGALTYTASGAIIAIAVLWFVAIGWVLHRMERTGAGSSRMRKKSVVPAT